MTAVSSQISAIPNSAATTGQNAALIQAQAQQAGTSGATAAGTASTNDASTTAAYPTASAPPMRDPSSSDPLLAFASEAQKAEASGGTSAAQTMLNEQEQVLNAFQTALGAWTSIS